MHLDSATNYFFAMEADASRPMLDFTRNHGQTELYALGSGHPHVACTVEDLEGFVDRIKL